MVKYEAVDGKGGISLTSLIDGGNPFDSPVLTSLIVVQILLTFFALIDWVKQDETRGPKMMWLFIILFISMLGPVLYFVIGKKE